MKLELVDSIEPLASDAGLVAELLGAANRSGGVPRQLVFGVRNLRGQIYRRITTENLDEVMAIAAFFERQGFDREGASSPGTPEGYDGVFSLT
jgi:hypothetical protein